MTLSVTRRLSFDAAHRLINHESKCRYVHGHRYELEASFTAPSVDDVGRIVDFGVIKARLGTWIDEHWDHTLILCRDDDVLGSAVDGITGQTTYYLPYNPTAENMARYLYESIIPTLFKDLPLQCTGLRLHETPNCYADIDGENT